MPICIPKEIILKAVKIKIVVSNKWKTIVNLKLNFKKNLDNLSKSLSNFNFTN